MRQLSFSMLIGFAVILTSCADSSSKLDTDLQTTDARSQRSTPRSDGEDEKGNSARHASHHSVTDGNHSSKGTHNGDGHTSHNAHHQTRHGHRDDQQEQTSHADHRVQPTDGAHGKSQAAVEHKPHTKPTETDTTTEGPDDDDVDALTIFNRRILPIMKAANPSSCADCHLSGVDLKNYILEDQAKTFASLKASGLIDVKNPDRSKILQFIERKPEKTSPLSEKVRRQELRAFRAWIRSAVREPELLKATATVTVGTTLPPEVIRHARTDRVLSSFIDNIWSEMGRCINCHSPERNRNKIKKLGRKKADTISWIIPRDPAGTLKKLVEGGNINVEDPESSPVLTKPAGIEEHGGGPKFLVGSTTYGNFAMFLNDYAAIANGKYKAPRDLPEPPRELILLTEQHLRIVDIPANANDKPLQVDIYRWDQENRRWSETRWATAFNRVNGKRRMWQSPISLAAPTVSPRANESRKLTRLPAGSYLAKIYIDQEGRTQENPQYKLGQREFVGQAKIKGNWPPGYQRPKAIDFPKSKRR